MRKRLDIALVERELIKTRSKAQALIMAGKVKVNDTVQSKAGHNIKDSDKIEILEDLYPYVSRGGLKLEHALKHFKIEVKDRICLDVGASTGGFSDCLLQSGAKLVYAVDVGKGQLDSNLAKNPRLKFMPFTNARYLKPKLFDLPPTVAVVDVSFISLKLVLPAVIKSLKAPADIIALIKPQFELTRKQAPGGIVKDENYRKQAVENLRNFLVNSLLGSDPKSKFTDKGVIASPIKGAKGNIEFLWYIKLVHKN
jgi:23S rRNA (cytidine1920-2'-O)/16S rRNA (cytidine1409-2'-O)-methyltransferase